MSFRKTACLASLLLSFPLVAPTLSVAGDYDPHRDIKATGTAASSGTSKDNPRTETPDAGTYEKIYIGHAERLGITAGKAEASYNTGILGSGVTATQYIYGGSATTNSELCNGIALEARGNTIIMEDGSSVEGGGSFLPAIYGGYAVSKTIITATADASENVVTIKQGASLTADDSYSNEIYGGYAKLGFAHGSSSATALGNSVTIEEGVSLPKFEIYAGWAGGTVEVTANGNTATLTSMDSEEQKTFAAGGYAQGFDNLPSEDSTARVHANKNTVTIASSIMYDVRGGCALYGAYAESNENTLTMTGGKAYAVFAGEASIKNYGEADSQKITYAWKNTLSLQDTASTIAFGGYAYAENDAEGADTTVSQKEAYATENTLIVNGGSYRDAGAGGAVSDNIAEATGNCLYLNYDPQQGKSLETETKISGVLYGGYAAGKTAKASGNRGKVVNAVFSEGDHSEGDYFIGGYAYSSAAGGSAEASGNIFEAEGGTYNSMRGGCAYSSAAGGSAEGKSNTTANKNELTISNASVQTAIDGGEDVGGEVYGGYAKSGGGDAAADSNKLTISGGTYSATIIGGLVENSGGDATANNNTVRLYGGTYDGNICGGIAYTESASSTAESGGNTIEIHALNGVLPSFSASTVIWGGRAFQGGEDAEIASRGNTLVFHEVQGLSAANIKNFDNLVFILPDMEAGQTVMALAGSDETNIDGANISVDVNKLSDIDSLVGSRITLLSSAASLSAEDITSEITYTKGSTLYWDDFELLTDDKSLYLTRTGEEAKVAPGTKAIAEGAAAGLALVNESANTAIDFVRSFSPASSAVTPFMHIQGSSATHETGSHVSLSSLSLMAGLGTGIDTGAGILSAGAFFEYGTGSYTTSNTFDNAPDVNGDGKSWYMGGGILAKMEFLATGPGHFYAEGSAHMGSLHNEYDSSDLRDKYGRSAGFDMDSPYYSLHGGIGYVWNITEDHDLDIFGKYIWTRVQGDDETLTTGDKFEFDDMDSSRVRFGARYTYKGSERIKPYVGVAYEHEFAGSCDSRTFGHAVAAPSFEGDTGIGELGLAMTPSESLPLSINLGVQGYVGKKRGISGNCMVKYEF